jgi:hypothetical protein
LGENHNINSTKQPTHIKIKLYSVISVQQMLTQFTS